MALSGVPIHDPVHRQPCPVHAHGVPRRCTRDDPVEILRVSLCARDPLPAALRASIEIRESRRGAVERRDDGFCRHRHLVNRAVREVNQLFGMTGYEVGVVADMTGVGARRSRNRQRPQQPSRDTEWCPPAAIADRLQLPIPPRRREPHFDLDVRIAARGQRRSHPAERRQARIDLGRRVRWWRAGRRESTGSD